MLISVFVIITHRFFYFLPKIYRYRDIIWQLTTGTDTGITPRVKNWIFFLILESKHLENRKFTKFIKANWKARIEILKAAAKNNNFLMKSSLPKGRPSDIRIIEIWMEQICSKNAQCFFFRIKPILSPKN